MDKVRDWHQAPRSSPPAAPSLPYGPVRSLIADSTSSANNALGYLMAPFEFASGARRGSNPVAYVTIERDLRLTLISFVFSDLISHFRSLPNWHAQQKYWDLLSTGGRLVERRVLRKLELADGQSRGSR